MAKTFINYFPVEEAKSGIKIKPENRGKFTETKKRTGKTTEELTHSKNPLTRKRAIFAQNAAHFKHKLGGQISTNSDFINNLLKVYNIWDYRNMLHAQNVGEN